MTERVFVIGVGMTKFEKPGSKEWDYPDMGREAGQQALADAGIDYADVDQAFLAYCYGESTAGQRALYELGLSGIPAVNVNNNCSTGSSALYLGRKFIQGGLADCVLALGFEKMEKGSLGVKYTDRTNPLDKHLSDMVDRRGIVAAPPAAQIFGNAGREYMERYGVSAESFARIGEKNHRHSVNNPYSQFQDEYTLEDILNAPTVYDPLTKLQCCPTSDGGAAAILASERYVREHDLGDKAVEIVGQAMVTDFESTFSGSDMSLAGFDMTAAAARSVYDESGLGPEDVDVIELHDCFSANELITYEGLGLCDKGGAGELIDSGAVTYGGRVVVNPSGGLISKGHPLGATGLAQCSELTWQLRGQADKRQVEGASIALQHNLGLGGAAVVTMYRKTA
ncbi:MAG TPA: lipid-transfer protein [Acidimicrobiales bacterium]